MAYRNTWKNADDLEVPFGPQVIENLDAGTNHTKGKIKQIQMHINYEDLPESTEAHTAKDFYLPEDAYVVSAHYIADTDFDAAVSFGTSQKDGTAIDVDGLIASATTTGEGSGDLVGTTVGQDSYLIATPDAGDPTQGEGTLFVEYII